MKMGGLHSLTSKGFVATTSVDSLTAPAIAVSESIQDQINHEILHASAPSIITIIELLVRDAHQSGASDIHFDPRGMHTTIRFRIDGLLEDTYQLPSSIHIECISRIKVLSGLRIDEHQSPQDGRFQITLPKVGLVDVRVSIVPTYYGENAVLRVLSDHDDAYTLDKLGFTVRNRDKILHALKKSHGLILCTGPTGSGKTTTLYSLLHLLNKPERAIITIEDPIEYSLGTVNQIQINPRTGLTFGNGLRSILRQDPDIIMVGEIRDTETAGLAVNASLTGHLLLSTLHTNDAPSTPLRLLEMGIEPYLVSSTLSLIVGQRLVRRVCEECKEQCQIESFETLSLPDEIVTELQKSKTNFAQGKGCLSCKGTGYKGRVGIHEIIEMNESLRLAVASRDATEHIRRIAIETGMTPLLVDGIRKAARCITTIEEVLRVQYE